MPSAPAKRIGEIVKMLQSEPAQNCDRAGHGSARHRPVESLPNTPVEIQDLLGREPVTIETNNIREFLVNRRVMVTGAGGSIGSELCRQIAAFEPGTVAVGGTIRVAVCSPSSRN
jgi:FlaA1/EpsC-like NDP-sugar epimerase